MTKNYNWFFFGFLSMYLKKIYKENDFWLYKILLSWKGFTFSGTLVKLHDLSKHRPSGPMLFISGNGRLSVCPSVCPSVRVFTFEVLFKRLFAPTSRSRMSNIFRDFESSGKSNGKKWSQIWTFCLWNWSKIATQKKVFFFLLILPYKTCWKTRFPMD